MKKTITPLLCAIILALASFGAVFAQPGTFYKVHFIKQTFDEIDVLPTGWSVRAGTSGATLANLGRSGGMAIAANTGGKWLSFSGSGAGSRGAELLFPSTTTYSEGYPADSIWNIEFDWTLVTTAASLSAKNAEAIVFSGSNGVATTDAGGWYLPGVFGLYVWKDGGFMHYMNSDRDGLQKRDASGNLIPGETNGHAILAGNSQAWRRATATDPATQSPVGTADSLNAPSATKVIIAIGGTYHITAKIDFKVASQKVLKLIITDIANPVNTDTIGEKAFLAPTYAGATSTVLPENRIVKDLSMLSMINTRSSNGGNGNTTQLAGSGIDNMEVYVLKESVGIADVTVNYLDQSNGAVKTSRVVVNQQVGSLFNLASADKEKVVDATNYYAYDVDATHLANAGEGSGESLIVDFAGNTNSLTVKFKKSAKTDGLYVWTGVSNSNWDELSDNFSVNSGPAQSYQTGNATTFVNAATLNKGIVVNGTIDLGANNVNVFVPDYTFSGTGKLTGTGNFVIDASTTLGVNNLLDGGVVINTTSPVIVKHAVAAKKFTTTADGATLKMGVKSAEADFVGLPITGNGGALNLVIDSIAPHNLNITNIPTFNVLFNQEGRLRGVRWSTTLGGTVTKRSQVNVTTSKTDFILPTGFSVQSKTLDSVKVNLGNHVRVLRDYNENANNNDVIYIGELTGSATSYLEGGWVDGRCSGYNIGSLGTDAVFNGGIRAYQKYTPATDTTPEIVTSGTSGIRLTKVGAGSLTINGVIDFPNVSDITKYNSITVGAGTLILGNKVYLDSIKVPHVINVINKSTLVLMDSIVTPTLNAMTLKVDTLCTLKANDNFVGLYNININGTLEDGLKAGVNLTISKTATVKLDVTSFTGAFEKIEALGDIKVDSAKLEINVVNTPNIGDKIALFTAGAVSDIRFRTVTVNGNTIVSNGVAVPNKEYSWVYDLDYDMFSGQLLYSGSNGINTIKANKEIKGIEYFDLSGRPVSKYAEGVIIKKITYTDGSIDTEKTFVKRK